VFFFLYKLYTKNASFRSLVSQVIVENEIFKARHSWRIQHQIQNLLHLVRLRVVPRTES